MNILFYAGESALTYAFPEAQGIVNGFRYARTAYTAFRIGASFFSGDVVGGVTGLVSAGATYIGADPTIGPAIPSSEGNLAAYINCVNNCYREHHNDVIWFMTSCLASCEQYR